MDLPNQQIENGLPRGQTLQRKSSIESQANTVESDSPSPGLMFSPSPHSVPFFQSPNPQMSRQMFGGVASPFNPALLGSFKSDKGIIGGYPSFYPISPDNADSSFKPPTPPTLGIGSTPAFKSEASLGANGYHSHLMSRALSMAMMPPGIHSPSYGVGGYPQDIQGLFISAAAQAISAALKPIPPSSSHLPHGTAQAQSLCDPRYKLSPNSDLLSSVVNSNKRTLEQAINNDLSNSSRARRIVPRSGNSIMTYPARIQSENRRKRRNTSDCGGIGTQIH
ncbi:unnamed protein product [Clavelina lepadiformis]|uniref:Uncharacterized protein n=1 Tax=Clavelina lepadiformis TaxID=159417 RepID=A0ABP0F2G4_CLALP